MSSNSNANATLDVEFQIYRSDRITPYDSTVWYCIELRKDTSFAKLQDLVMEAIRFWRVDFNIYLLPNKNEGKQFFISNDAGVRLFFKHNSASLLLKICLLEYKEIELDKKNTLQMKTENNNRTEHNNNNNNASKRKSTTTDNSEQSPAKKQKIIHNQDENNELVA